MSDPQQMTATNDDRSRLTPAAARAAIRAGRWRDYTGGACLGHVQANLVVLPVTWAEDFAAMCTANLQALPLLEMSAPGIPDALRCAPGADLRTDLPGYHVFRHGAFEGELATLEDVWRDDLVAFLLGSSNSGEDALLAAGVRLRQLELDLETPMFVTSITCSPVGRFAGPMVVAMRAIAEEQVELAREVMSQHPVAHGAPVHAGDPSAIGIDDLQSPAWGDPIELAPGEVPVFWACGATPQTLIRTAKPEFAITHAPGKMFITDLRLADAQSQMQTALTRTTPS